MASKTTAPVNKTTAPVKKIVKVRLQRTAKATKTTRPPRVVRQLTRFITRLDRMAARAQVLRERATKRTNGSAAAAAHEKAHTVLSDAKQRIAGIAKEAGR
jgi:hypothetical protein